MKPKKSLGQNFLANKKIAYDIVEAADLSMEDVVLEIGPGKGVLTELMLEKAGKVFAVEKDDELAVFLKEKFSKEISEGKLVLLNDDILSFDPKDHGIIELEYKLVANIPYYITGEIFRRFLSEVSSPSLMVLMVQKEVAQRVLARDGKESILSLSVKSYGKPHYIETVKAGNFYPKPNVDSAVLKINGISHDFFRDFSSDLFFEVIKAGFSHKRKFLISNLKDHFEDISKEKFEEMFGLNNISVKSRAEDISLEQWKSFCLFLKNYR
ncbi:MAG: 16S rRNA (adenine(1518)-N(6)/adenine(1519)-N(6))-dimethyltransferase RsmA [Candidatus Paceibacterota bacterium]